MGQIAGRLPVAQRLGIRVAANRGHQDFDGEELALNHKLAGIGRSLVFVFESEVWRLYHLSVALLVSSNVQRLAEQIRATQPLDDPDKSEPDSIYRGTTLWNKATGELISR